MFVWWVMKQRWDRKRLAGLLRTVLLLCCAGCADAPVPTQFPVAPVVAEPLRDSFAQRLLGAESTCAKSMDRTCRDAVFEMLETFCQDVENRHYERVVGHSRVSFGCESPYWRRTIARALLRRPLIDAAPAVSKVLHTIAGH